MQKRLMRRSMLFLVLSMVVVSTPTPAWTQTQKPAGQRALDLYNSHKYAAAADGFETALKAGPTPRLCYYAALANQGAGRSMRAKQLFQYIISTFPATTEASYAKQALGVSDGAGNDLPESVMNALPPGILNSEMGRKAIQQVMRDHADQIATIRQAEHKGLMNAGRVSSAVQSAGLSEVGASGARAQDDSDSDEPKDMSSLPDRASFYFTKTPSGHMAVDLLVNGHPVKALFDTGASAFFYKDQLRAAGVDVNKTVSGGQARGWAGVAVPITRMPADIKLGTLTRRVNIAMEDSATGFPENLIGQDFVRGYQYEIDDKAGRVDLHKAIASGGQRTDSLYDVPCTRRGDKDVVQIEVNGHRISAFIDTGSDATIIDPATAEKIGLEPSGETEGRIGVGGAHRAAISYATIRIGPVRKENFRVRITGTIGCCIGQDFMEGWRCKVDREHNLLRFFH